MKSNKIWLVLFIVYLFEFLYLFGWLILWKEQKQWENRWHVSLITKVAGSAPVRRDYICRAAQLNQDSRSGVGGFAGQSLMPLLHTPCLQNVGWPEMSIRVGRSWCRVPFSLFLSVMLLVINSLQTDERTSHHSQKSGAHSIKAIFLIRMQK